MTTSASAPITEPLRHVSLPIEGMTCASCVGRVEKVLSRVPGVSDVRVNLATEKADLRASNDVSAEMLAEAVERAGYHVASTSEPAAMTEESTRRPGDRNAEKEHTLRQKVWLAAALSLPILVLEMGTHLVPSLHHWLAEHLGQNTSWNLQLLLTTLVMVGPGREIFGHGVRAFLRAAPDMNSLVALGTASAFGFSLVATLAPQLLPASSRYVYFEAAAVVITLVLAGRLLETKAKGRTSEAISRLVRLSPDVASVKRDGVFVDVRTQDVVRGDLLLIKPGARVPVDGVVVEGESHVDESMLTGEPIPVHKSPGAVMRAGTVNQTGSVTLRASAVAGNTLLAQIVRMVEQAQASKLPIQALVDRITLWFVPVVMVVAVLTFLAWLVWGPEPRLASALVNAVSVLIIACPCAMGLATPTSILVGTGRGAELGMLFRHGEALERLQQTKVVAFDKTGTLTLGQPSLTDWVDAPSFTREATLGLLASLEDRSEHPIAKAVVRAAKEQSLNMLPVTDFRNEVGLAIAGTVGGRAVAAGAPRHFAHKGLDLRSVEQTLAGFQAEGKTALVVTMDDRVAAAFAISDPIKPTAFAAVADLQAQGIAVAMVTGDNQQTANKVASELRIPLVIAEVLPTGKVEALRELGRTYGTVAFVGDGINDAPVLVEADVGIAMGAGTDIAIEAADVVLMRDDLALVPRAIALSRATLGNIRQNLFWAFVYNAALIPIAAGVLQPVFGISLSPMLGGLAMALSSVLVVGNALRLRGFGTRLARNAAPQATEHT